jgi:hypothetical protein
MSDDVHDRLARLEAIVSEQSRLLLTASDLIDALSAHVMRRQTGAERVEWESHHESSQTLVSDAKSNLDAMPE